MLVAKTRFDDGTKIVNGKSQVYELGEEYRGKKPPEGLVQELKDYKAALKKAEDSEKSLDFVLKENQELRNENESLKKELSKKKSKDKK